MRVTRFTSFAATASIFMTPLATGTDSAVSSLPTVVPGGDGDGFRRHDEPFHRSIGEEVVMQLVDDDDGGDSNPDAGHRVHMGKHDEKYVTTDAVKYTASALDDDVKKLGVHDGAVHAESIGTAAAAAVTHHVHPRGPAPFTTTTQSCSSSNNVSPLVTPQQLQLSPTPSPASTNGNNITFFAAAEASTTTICTPISWTNTNAFTTDAACPTPYENGTYCGFVNPEDPCAKQSGGMFYFSLSCCSLLRWLLLAQTRSSSPSCLTVPCSQPLLSQLTPSPLLLET